MKYFFESIRTFSYWRYALFSPQAVAKILAVIGGLYTFLEMLDFFKIYTKDKYSGFAFGVVILVAVLYALATRRPVSRVRYKVPKKDITFEVRIDDLFKVDGEIVISSSSTFDTDMASGLIASKSLQGQFATEFFNGQTVEIDRQIDVSLANEQCFINEKRPGKKKEYPIGTVAKVTANGRNFYFLAMSHMMESKNAYSDLRILDEALDGLWKNLGDKAEIGDIVVPVFGTARGRISVPRKNIVERIAQSFANAVHERQFSNKLTIVIRPEDAAKFAVNLFQIKDFLTQSLHV